MSVPGMGPITRKAADGSTHARWCDLFSEDSFDASRGCSCNYAATMERAGVPMPAVTDAVKPTRLARATFTDCRLCAAIHGEPVVCRGHDEADALGLLDVPRLAFFNAGVAALVATLNAVRRSAEEEEEIGRWICVLCAANNGDYRTECKGCGNRRRLSSGHDAKTEESK